MNGQKQRTIDATRKILMILAIFILVILGFLAQRGVPFMMDDEWYSTNLATGQPLAGLGDVIESQIWHFMNWGGRCVTHGVLQLTLMLGELGADILNLVMILTLTLLICVILREKSLQTFLLVHSMIYSMNANLKMSMLWQAGTVNYVYSSVWILLFLLPFLRILGEEENYARVPDWVKAVVLIPIGIMAGWSNENMGPACFLLAVFTAYYVKKYRKGAITEWMLSGIFSSLAGSILVVAAPGNFERSSVLEPQTFYDRFYSMLTAGVDFLLPSVVLAVCLLLIRLVCVRRKLNCMQWALLGFAIISYGAMVLSPHYPDRATFGTMVILILFSVSLLSEKEQKTNAFGTLRTGLTACFFLGAAGRLLAEILYL